MAENQRRNDSLAYVTPREPGQADAWRSTASRRPQLTDVTEVVPPREVATALSLAAGEKAAVRRRVILLDGDVDELADSYYPLEIARDTALLEEEDQGGCAHPVAELGHRARRASEDLESRGRRTRAHRPRPSRRLVLTLLRTTTAEDGNPIEVQFMVMKKALRRLHYEIEVD